jgi:hypothetical protein
MMRLLGRWNRSGIVGDRNDLIILIVIDGPGLTTPQGADKGQKDDGSRRQHPI